MRQTKSSRNGDNMKNQALINKGCKYFIRNIRTFKPVIPLTVVLLLMTAIIPGYANNSPGTSNVSTYIVVFKDTPGTVQATAANDVGQMVKSCGGTVKYKYNVIDGMAVTIPDDMAGQLSSLPNVAYVQPDHMVHAQLDQAIPEIGANVVWDTGYNGTGVKVAVLDSGVDANHPDIGKSRVVAWADFVNHNNSTPYDDFGHGTFVTSVVAGTGAASNGLYRGVAPNASLVEAKVLNSGGDGHDSDIIAAIDWAIANGSKVISMSFGGKITNQSWTYPNADPSLYTAIDNAVNSGVTVVVAGGNYGPNNASITYPGDDPNIITVGAVTRSDMIEPLSSRGPTLSGIMKPDVVNVDDNIVAARAAGTSVGSAVGGPYDAYYRKWSGTSVSTPMTSGVVALMLQKNPSLTPAQIKSILEKSAKHLGNGMTSVPNNVYGYGRVQAVDAVDNVTYNGTLEFNKTAYSVRENASSVTIGVNRIDEAAHAGTVSISYNVSNNTALAGKDYIATNGTLTFNPGESFKTFSVGLKYNPLNDGIYEGNRTINLALTNPMPNTPAPNGTAGIDSYSTAVINVIDDAPAPMFQLNQSAYSANASTGALTVNVTRVNNATIPVTVQLNTSDGTVKAGQDYTATNVTLAFNQGEMSHTVQIPIAASSRNGTFNVTLSNATGGATIGTPGKAMVTIASSAYTFTYNLKKGWNLISIPIVPQDGNLTTFFSPMMSNVAIVWEYNSSNASNPWAYYTTMTDKYQQGTLRTVNERLGYWVRCTNDTNFTLTGSLPATSNVTLNSGWNLVGNPTSDIRQPWTAYSTAKIILQYDSSNTTSPWSYYTTMTDKYQQGSLTELKPGYGYWVRI